MISEIRERDWKTSNSLIALQTSCCSEYTSTMEPRVRKNVPYTNTMRETSCNTKSYTTNYHQMNESMMMRNDREYRGSFSQGNGKKAVVRGGYFGLESMLLLVCLTASLLILPLILPPLPPPPFLLLLLPIGILGLLMILAFMPSNVKNLTYM